jgi:hypothetical protein
MSPQPLTVVLLAFAVINGMFSPLLLPQSAGAVLLLAPGLLISSPRLAVFLAYLLGAAVTVMLAGVPAAIYERLAGLNHSTPASMGIWLAGAAVLTLPALLQLLKIGF